MIKFKRFSTLLVLACILSFSLTAQQSSCVGGLSDGYPCDKVALASRVNLLTLGGATGNDVWGYHSPTGREFALMGLTNGVAFVDVTVPTAPVVIGNLASHGNSTSSPWRDIRTKNGYAYIGADKINGHGIQVFDLSQLDAAASGPASSLPITFTETSHVDFGINGHSHNMVTNLDSASKFLYAVGQRAYCSGGVTVFDLTDPEMPTQEQCYNADGYSHDMICIKYRGPDVAYIGQEICIGFNETIYSIIDMTDKNDIIGISAQTYNGEGYTHQGWISDDHKYLMLDDELDEIQNNHNVRTYFFDISDLDNPVPLTNDYYEHSISTVDHNMFVKGPYLYQANYEAGLRILDISDLDNGISTISEAGFFDILPSQDTRGSGGAWGVFPYLPSGSILLSGLNDVDNGVQTGGLFVLTPNLPHHYLTTTTTSGIQTICAGTSSVDFIFNKNDMYEFSSTVNYIVEDLDPSLSSTITTTATATTVNVNISSTGSLTDNTYFTIKSIPANGSPTSKISGAIIVNMVPVAAPLLVPADNATTVDETPDFVWTPDSDTDTYNVEIATDAGFTNIVQDSTGLTTNQYTAMPLADNTEYFWRTISVNECGQTTSTVFSFTLKTGIVPVELTVFDGEHRNKINLLRWVTAAETNNAGFEIQRKQVDRDREFETIGWVDAITTNGANYKFTDAKITAGARYYYRLKQLDLDDNFEFSPTITIKVAGNHPGLIIYPNPVKDQISLDLYLPDLNSAQLVNFSIFNFTGQEVQQWTFNPDMPFSTQKINVENLSPGVYIGMITKGAVRLPVRFVKW